MSNLKKTKKLTVLAFLLASAFILSWIEFVIDIPLIIPGIKLGLANIIILFTIYMFNPKDALFVLIGRLILNAILFGNLTTMLYSVSGGILSFLIMCIVYHFYKSEPIITSVFGGMFHNIGQILTASLVLKSDVVFTYLPYLLIAGIITGAINGFIVRKINLYIKKYNRPVH